MFLKKSLHKDLIKRLTFARYEKSLLFYKFLYKNKFLDPTVRLLAYNLYIGLGVKTTQINNLCLATGRSRGVVGKYKLSRIVFRTFCEKGTLKGIYKK